jgi:hypothetical protein
MRQEIEAPSIGIFHRLGNFPALVRKPSDLIIESIQGSSIGVCKNRPRNRVQISRDGLSRGSENIPRHIPLPVDVLKSPRAMRSFSVAYLSLLCSSARVS